MYVCREILQLSLLQEMASDILRVLPLPRPRQQAMLPVSCRHILCCRPLLSANHLHTYLTCTPILHQSSDMASLTFVWHRHTSNALFLTPLVPLVEFLQIHLQPPLQ